MDEELKNIIFVGGLDELVNESTLRDLFSSFGDIRNIEIPLNAVIKKHRGFAFIQYYEEEDAKHAIYNMNNFKLFGKMIHVNLAKHKKEDNLKPIWLDDLYNQEQLKMYEEAQQNSENTEEEDEKGKEEGKEKEVKAEKKKSENSIVTNDEDRIISEIENLTFDEKTRLEELLIL